MKYTVEIDIDRPVGEIIELFDNTDNMSEWMEGLLSFEHLDGDPGETGATSRLRFEMNTRIIEMIETITAKNLPEEFTATYEADGVFNTVNNRFLPISGDKTKWVSENEFRFTNIGMKIVGFFMPGAFKKQSMKYLENFKAFAESS